MALAVRGSAWDPFTLVRQWDTDFDDLIRRGFRGTAQRPATTFAPAADVVRDGNDVLVTLELPGVDVESDIDIEVLDGRLTITGKRADAHESRTEGVLVREIRSGGFRRQFTLPKGVTAEQIEADYDKGLLTVRVHDVVRPAPVAAKVKVRSLTGAESAPKDTPPKDTAGEDTATEDGAEVTQA
jgi:HSP20 family protein